MGLGQTKIIKKVKLIIFCYVFGSDSKEVTFSSFIQEVLGEVVGVPRCPQGSPVFLGIVNFHQMYLA